MKKLIIIFLVIVTNNLYSQEVDTNIPDRVTEFFDPTAGYFLNKICDTIPQWFEDVPCIYVSFTIDTTYKGTIYVGNAESAYNKDKCLSMDAGIGFIVKVSNLNELWYMGSELSENEILNIRYLKENDDEE